MSRPTLARLLRPAAWLLGLAGAYAGFATLVFVAQGSTAPASFLAAAVSPGVMFLVAAAVALVIVVVEVIVDHPFGIGASTAVWFGLANGAEPLLGPPGTAA